MDSLSKTEDQAWLLPIAATSAHSGDWLHALLLSGCAVHIAVGLRLGEHHQCPCGATVDAKGLHGLSCKASTPDATAFTIQYVCFRLRMKSLALTMNKRSWYWSCLEIFLKFRPWSWQKFLVYISASHSYRERMEDVSHGTSRWRIRWHNPGVHGDCSWNHGSHQQRRYGIPVEDLRIRLLRLWFQVTYCQHCPWFRCVNR